MIQRTVIVTGGFGVLGRAIAAAFTAVGDRVARVDFAPRAPDGAAALDVGGVDLADPVIAQRVVDQVADALGATSVLVNAAGGFVWRKLEDASPIAWERMFRMNTLTAVNMTSAALPTLARAAAGRIINVGAAAAITAAAGMGAYAASKSGVHRLTESLAAELSGQSVTVNAVLPSIIDTPANRADMPDANFATWIHREALAEVILFLASPAARAITGALLPVTRGTSS
jgi:NAD(P)-dependent dehydrogenase (short-subunit alcohol dehydrogenase family)